MKIKSVLLAYFSPTGTTRKTVKAIAEGTGIADILEVDLTKRENETKQIKIDKDQLVILGVPVYSGRVPIVAEQRLESLKGSGNPVVSVVLYGNRAYEDALLELTSISEKMGMKPVGGGAFIGEHSFSAENTPIAKDRPDTSDADVATAFGQKVMEKLASVPSVDALDALKVPGDFPYKERKIMPPISPITDEETCVKCGQCAEVCPVAVVTVGDTVETRAEDCIRCCACVRVCPTDSRKMEHPKIQEIAQWLTTEFSQPKAPETYL